MDAQSFRNVIPLPKANRPILGWTLFIIGAIWLYDAYDGKGKSGPWPLSAILPW